MSRVLQAGDDIAQESKHHEAEGGQPQQAEAGRFLMTGQPGLNGFQLPLLLMQIRIVSVHGSSWSGGAFSSLPRAWEEERKPHNSPKRLFDKGLVRLG
jgi:hypothetical protein